VHVTQALDQLLVAAGEADGSDRIKFRDAIAEYGDRAIPAMIRWLPNARLGAFAVRVLLRIAQDSSTRGAVLRALVGLDLAALSTDVVRDVETALSALRPPKSPPGSPRGAGNRSGRYKPPLMPPDATVEERFHQAMLDIYWLAGEASGYWASYFLRAVRKKGGLAEARDLLRMSGTSDGFERLTAERRLDLSMEALVLDPRYSALFTTDEIEIARARLANAGFDPNDRRA
jgi:hypothetical protein